VEVAAEATIRPAILATEDSNCTDNFSIEIPIFSSETVNEKTLDFNGLCHLYSM